MEPSSTNASPEIADPPITQSDATPLNAVPSNDVVMSHEGSGGASEPNALDDDNLPQWLTSMFKYLRGVARDTAWQDLVTEFLDFEKSCPSLGVSFFYLLSLSYSRM